MKRNNYDEKALSMARRMESEKVLREGKQCLICRSWHEPCPACQARNGRTPKAPPPPKWRLPGS